MLLAFRSVFLLRWQWLLPIGNTRFVKLSAPRRWKRRLSKALNTFPGRGQKRNKRAQETIHSLTSCATVLLTRFARIRDCLHYGPTMTPTRRFHRYSRRNTHRGRLPRDSATTFAREAGILCC